MILEAIAQELAALYHLEDCPPITPFLVGHQKFTAYCHIHPHLDTRCRETLLIEADREGLQVGLYVAPSILHTIEAVDPRTTLHRGNIDAACAAIEGVSHLLCFLWKTTRDIPCSLLELELQAEIDKYLLCAAWLRRQGESATLLLARLFQDYRLLGDLTPEAAWRYRRASYLAEQFCAVLEHEYQRRHRLGDLRSVARQFYRLSHWQKLQQTVHP